MTISTEAHADLVAQEVLRLIRLLVIVRVKPRALYEVWEICECPRCEATWPWGEIGAQKKGRRR